MFYTKLQYKFMVTFFILSTCRQELYYDLRPVFMICLKYTLQIAKII